MRLLSMQSATSITDEILIEANSWPTIKASSAFVGLGVLSTNKYIGSIVPGPDGKDAQYYVNTANFYRQIRNFKVDIRATDPGAYVCAIHYQIAQATSLQFVELIADSSTTQQGMCKSSSEPTPLFPSKQLLTLLGLSLRKWKRRCHG